MPGAVWIGPTVNEDPGAELAVYGLILHIQQGTEAGTEAWERNPLSEVSSHFLAPRAGGVRQMVDTADKAWCQVDGNSHWISVECEGYSGQPLTPAQVEAAAQILAWLHTVYGVPLTPANDPSPGSVAHGGLGYHAMGGSSWGGHYDCPGAPVINQRPAICARAAQLAGAIPVPAPAPEGDDMLTHWTTVQQGRTGTAVYVAQGLLIAHGYPVGSATGRPDGVFGPTTAASTRALQSACGISQDAVFGPHTLSVALYGHDYA